MKAYHPEMTPRDNAVTALLRKMAIVALCLHIAPVSAREWAPADTASALKEVVVRANKPLAAQQRISRSQIEATASSNVADALKYLAGVQIKDYGGLGGQKTVNVRSLGSQHVGVYLDGVRITNAQNGTVDLGKYSLSTLESVSLFNANKNEALMSASEYASASTVYLQTRRPDSTSLTVSGAAGSFNTYKCAATYSYKKWGFIDGAYTYSKGDYPFRYKTEYEDTTGTRRNGDIRMLRLEACGFYKGFQLHAYYFDSERGLPGGIVRRLSDTYTDVGREWDRNLFAQLTFRDHSGPWGARAIVKYSNDWLHYRSDYPDNISVHANNQYRQQDVYAAAAGSYEWRKLKFSASTDLRWSDLVCDVKYFKYVYRIDSKTSLAAFYSHRGLNASVSGLYTHITDRTDGQAKPLSRFTWNAICAYSLGKLTLRAFYKSVFRAPTLNDLYYTLVGNRNLRPEYTKQIDVGVGYDSGWLDLQADAYYNRVEDRIVCLPLKGSYQWTMLNYGYTRCLGVNISANAKYRGHSLMLSGSYQDDRNRTDPADDAYDDYIAYSPRWSLTAVYTIHCRGFYASLSHIFVDRRYWTAENSIEEPLKAYNCTDVKMGYKLALRRSSALTFEAECQNVFDDRYEIIQRWPMPGRRYALTIKFQL